jgi:hypothetical protein
MSTFATEDRVQLQRLGVSLAIALALHGAIAVALLNWGRTIFSANPAAPLVINIDLAPLIGAPSSPPKASEPAPAVGGGAAPVPGIQQAPEAGGAIIRRDSTEPAAVPPAPPAPAVPAPSRDGTEPNAGEGRSVSGGGGVSHATPEPGRGGASAIEPGAPAGNLMNTPLDTSVTVMPDLYSKKGGGGLGQKKKQGVFYRPPRHPGLVGQPERPGHVAQPEHPHTLSPGGGMTTNAVGAHVQDRARAALAREATRAAARNATGGVASPGIVGSGATTNAPEAVTKNAIGVTVPVHPNIPGTNTSEPKTGAVVAPGNPANRAAIGAHDMVRPGAAALIGGPARSRPGVLSGSDFHPRHP